jgi:hypothetical protein
MNFKDIFENGECERAGYTFIAVKQDYFLENVGCPKIGVEIDQVINLLVQLKDEGYKNVRFESDDPYCSTDMLVSKLENRKKKQ